MHWLLFFGLHDAKINKNQNQNHWVSYVEAAPILEYAYRGTCVRLVQVHRLGFASPWKKVVYFVNSHLGLGFEWLLTFVKQMEQLGGMGLDWFGLDWIELNGFFLSLEYSCLWVMMTQLESNCSEWMTKTNHIPQFHKKHTCFTWMTFTWIKRKKSKSKNKIAPFYNPTKILNFPIQEGPNTQKGVRGKGFRKWETSHSFQSWWHIGV